MSDLSIRTITIAEHADRAAARAVETGESQPNPHPPGTDEARRWKAAYERFLLKHSAPQAEGSA